MRILISPLDWGLGHTTRCIPIIHSFLQNGCTVYIACNTTQQRLLEQEFSTVHYLPLAGYCIRYASSKRWFALKILQQIPKILLAVQREHSWLKKATKKYDIDLIISDNRYGFYHHNIPSVFITHQLFIQTPYAWVSGWLQKMNYRFINRFRECWVPDFEGEINLAGTMSHPGRMPFIPVTYLGILSRFKNITHTNYQYTWLILLSGPEPQRTLLENMLIEKLSSQTVPVLLVRGLPAHADRVDVPNHFTVVNHMSTSQMQEAFTQCEYVISRSGYTTVMDIIFLQKKSLLIPTPGQTEQEYLAKQLGQKHWCVDCASPDLLLRFMETIDRFDYQFPALPKTDLNAIVRKTIQKFSQAE